MGSGTYTGVWTPWQEDWFSLRLEKIRNGTERPRTAKEWKKILTMWRDTREVGEKMDMANKIFIERNIVRGQ